MLVPPAPAAERHTRVVSASKAFAVARLLLSTRFETVDPHANVFATLPNEIAELILAHGLEGDDKFVTASAGHFLIKFCSLSNASRALFTRSHHLLCPRTLAAFNRRARDRLLTALLAYCNEAFIAKLKSPRTRARACVEFVNAVSRSSWRVELRWDAWVGRPVSREGLLAYGRITVFNSRACLLYVWER
jgi:hypothetical protein